MKFGTKVIHAGIKPDESTGAIMTPIFQTSTYVQASPGKHKGFEYSRTQNPTRTALQNNLAALENGKFGLCFSSGMGAIDAVAKLLQPGDEVICTNDLYGGTRRIFTKIFANYGIKFYFINMENFNDIEQYVNSKTKMIWVETPTNPMMNIVDIQGVVSIAKKHGLKVVVDNTFASPYLQNPLDLGVDIVLHSVTKYIGGHSDVVMGALMMNDATMETPLSKIVGSTKLILQLEYIQNSCGAVSGPQDCFLVLRGIKTLHVRMQRHCENGRKIADFLVSHPRVDKVYYPGLKNHQNHLIAKKQMKDFGGMMSFNLKNNSLSDAIKIISNTQLFSLAESLGGVESLISHPASMTHSSIEKSERERIGISDSLIRLSVGIEDAEDLIEDLSFALSRK